MTVIYFGGIRFIVEQDEHDRFGTRVMNIVSGDIRLVATKDIRENYWLLSNGQRFEMEEVWIKEEK